MLQTHHITPFKKIFSGKHTSRTTLANVWLGKASRAVSRHATRPAPPPTKKNKNKSWAPLGKSCIRPGLLLRNLFEDNDNDNEKDFIKHKDSL